jgi:nucleoside-diphosphate-sugar epimerase
VNFLVTGGAGFIGSHVCERLLHSGHAVWAFDDLNPFYDPRIKQRNLRGIQAVARLFEGAFRRWHGSNSALRHWPWPAARRSAGRRAGDYF